MKKFLLLILTLCLFQDSLRAQRAAFYEYSQPGYKAGVVPLLSFIRTNLVLPDSVKLGLAGGMALVQLEIDSLGSIQASNITKGIKGCAQCDKEVLRVVSLIPKFAFTPATENYKPIRSVYPLQVRFSPKAAPLDTYNSTSLYGRWLFRNPDHSKCIECAEIFFKPDNSARLGNDTLSWRLNDKELFISNSSFFIEPVYKVTFTGYYDRLKLEGKRSSYYLSRDW